MEHPVVVPKPKPSRPVNHPPAKLLTSWPERLTGDRFNWTDDDKDGQWIALRIIEDQSMLYQSILLLIDPISYRRGADIRLVNDARELQHDVGLDDVNQHTLNELARLFKINFAIYNTETGNWSINDTMKGNRIVLMIYVWGLIRPLVYYDTVKQSYTSIFEIDNPLMQTIGLTTF